MSFQLMIIRLLILFLLGSFSIILNNPQPMAPNDDLHKFEDLLLMGSLALGLVSK